MISTAAPSSCNRAASSVPNASSAGLSRLGDSSRTSSDKRLIISRCMARKSSDLGRFAIDAPSRGQRELAQGSYSDPLFDRLDAQARTIKDRDRAPMGENRRLDQVLGIILVGAGNVARYCESWQGSE